MDFWVDMARYFIIFIYTIMLYNVNLTRSILVRSRRDQLINKKKVT